MDILTHLLCAAAGVFIGVFIGNMIAKHDKGRFNTQLVDIAIMWKNIAEKQAKQIKWIHDGMIYLSVSDLEDLYEEMIDDGYSEDHPIMMVDPLRDDDLYYI